MLNSGRCKQGFINENGRCVADNYGVGHKNQASCSYIEAGAVVELSDSTFIQMLQVRSRPSSPPRCGTPWPFQKMGMKEYASLAKSSCCPFGRLHPIQRRAYGRTRRNLCSNSCFYGLPSLASQFLMISAAWPYSTSLGLVPCVRAHHVCLAWSGRRPLGRFSDFVSVDRRAGPGW